VQLNNVCVEVRVAKDSPRTTISFTIKSLKFVNKRKV
jgi:hypothetical protein